MAKTKTRGSTDGVPLRRRCGTMQVYQRLLETSASYRVNQHDLEHLTARRHAVGLARRSAKPVVIQDVVHVVHHTSAENISEAQIKSQIAVLNQDYRAKNADKTKTLMCGAVSSRTLALSSRWQRPIRTARNRMESSVFRRRSAPFLTTTR